MEDTIAAITTAQGLAGVGIIRVSGSEAAIVAQKVFRSKKGKVLREQPTHTVTYGHIVDEQGQVLDEALALTMWGPHSFTCEDVVELQCHGGTVVLQKTLELLLRNGARLAEPGEFSKRAFLNGRLDLSQAEAIMELITAKTEKGVLAAAGNLEGSISQKVSAVRSKILEITAYLEADIDFPEEEFERLQPEELAERIALIVQEVKDLIASYNSGRIIREGLKTALIGKPNVGKSSLLNALLREKRAIVTDIPGTTRDVIQEYYNLGGIPLVLYDTAGLRDTDDLVEQIGVEKTKEVIKEADLILYVLDSTEGFTQEDRDIVSQLPRQKTLLIINKIDLLDGKDEAIAELPDLAYPPVYISAKERVGLEELEKTIAKMFLQDGGRPSSEPILTNVRQKDALARSLELLESAWTGAREGLSADFISIDLRGAWEILGEISGETLGEDIIDQIFSQFCLGK